MPNHDPSMTPDSTPPPSFALFALAVTLLTVGIVLVLTVLRDWLDKPRRRRTDGTLTLAADVPEFIEEVEVRQPAPEGKVHAWIWTGGRYRYVGLREKGDMFRVVEGEDARSKVDAGETPALPANPANPALN